MATLLPFHKKRRLQDSDHYSGSSSISSSSNHATAAESTMALHHQSISSSSTNSSESCETSPSHSLASLMLERPSQEMTESNGSRTDTQHHHDCDQLTRANVVSLTNIDSAHQEELMEDAYWNAGTANSRDAIHPAISNQLYAELPHADAASGRNTITEIAMPVNDDDDDRLVNNTASSLTKKQRVFAASKRTADDEAINVTERLADEPRDRSNADNESKLSEPLAIDAGSYRPSVPLPSPTPLTLYDKLKQRRARQSEMAEQQQQQQQAANHAEAEFNNTTLHSKEASSLPIKSSVAARLKRVQVGSRIAVYWDGEEAYYSGTVKKIREERKRPHFVDYDDGDREWVNLASEDFRFLKKKKKIKQQKESLSSSVSGATLKPGKKKKRRMRDGIADVKQFSSELTIDATSPSKQESDTSLRDPGAAEVVQSKQSLETSLVNSLRQAASSRTDSYSGGASATPLVSILGESRSWVEESVKRSDSDSETDEEEIMGWAVKMFGIQQPPAAKPHVPVSATLPKVPPCGIEDFHHRFSHPSVQIPISEKVKRRRQKFAESPEPICVAKKVSSKRKKALAAQEASDTDRRRRDANRPLTRDEIQDILRIEDDVAADGSNYVRRSMRQPNRAALHTHGVKSLVDKLRNNDTDMIVLKMKRYITDPDSPPMVIDAFLDALEENSNCEALYIQNFNQGMRDEQVLRLIKILQMPSCKIWCLNIGENYQVKMKTWEKFTAGLKNTKITHMYTSEHTITHAIKDELRAAMRDNRKKHDMHNNPNNLDTIIQCTHCWWNPINSKRLQPFLKKKGYDHILMDVESQGLKGTMSGAFIT